ncbi:hypothetical protein TNCV_4138871 [Trichonephila clavipes]|nr:hypothetical protein TNCV_4138871 [Trichonephila clavipes]
MIWLVLTPVLREDTWKWSGASHLSTPSTNHIRGLAARRLFRVSPCRKGMGILYKLHVFSGIRTQSLRHRRYLFYLSQRGLAKTENLLKALPAVTSYSSTESRSMRMLKGTT